MKLFIRLLLIQIVFGFNHLAEARRGYGRGANAGYYTYSCPAGYQFNAGACYPAAVRQANPPARPAPRAPQPPPTTAHASAPQATMTAAPQAKRPIAEVEKTPRSARLQPSPAVKNFTRIEGYENLAISKAGKLCAPRNFYGPNECDPLQLDENGCFYIDKGGRYYGTSAISSKDAEKLSAHFAQAAESGIQLRPRVTNFIRAQKARSENVLSESQEIAKELEQDLAEFEKEKFAKGFSPLPDSNDSILLQKYREIIEVLKTGDFLKAFNLHFGLSDCKQYYHYAVTYENTCKRNGVPGLKKLPRDSDVELSWLKPLLDKMKSKWSDLFQLNSSYGCVSAHPEVESGWKRWTVQAAAQEAAEREQGIFAGPPSLE